MTSPFVPSVVVSGPDATPTDPPTPPRTGGDDPPAPAPTTVTADSANPLLCGRLIAITTLRARGDRVTVGGIAQPGHAGQTVRIRHSGHTVATATVARDGTFRATGDRPTGKNWRAARYVAFVEGQASAAAELAPRLTITEVRGTTGDRVRIRARLRDPQRAVPHGAQVVRRAGCAPALTDVVGSADVTRRGTIAVTVHRAPSRFR